MNRIIIAVAALLAIAPAGAHGQTTAPTYQGQDGQTREAIGTFPAQGANTTPAPVDSRCTVVSGDQAYTVGTVVPLNCTVTGRLKTGVSSATNIAPAATPATTTQSSLVGCRYVAAPPTWSDTWTGAISCDATGAQRVALAAPLPAGSATIGNVNRALPFAPEATTTLAASATFTGAARDTGIPAGSPQPWNRFVCYFRSDQAGTGVVEASNDNFATTYILVSAAVTAATGNTGGTSIPTLIMARYNRCRLVNGTTATTTAPLILSSFVE